MCRSMWRSTFSLSPRSLWWTPAAAFAQSLRRDLCRRTIAIICDSTQSDIHVCTHIQSVRLNCCFSCLFFAFYPFFFYFFYSFFARGTAANPSVTHFFRALSFKNIYKRKLFFLVLFFFHSFLPRADSGVWSSSIAFWRVFFPLLISSIIFNAHSKTPPPKEAKRKIKSKKRPTFS